MEREAGAPADDMNRYLCYFVLVVFAPWVCAPLVRAQETSRSTLEQLNSETQSLYKEVQQGIVQVQLPSPRWINELAAQESPLDKWGTKLDPAVRSRLADEARMVASGQYRSLSASITSATQPSTPIGQKPTTMSQGTWRFTKGPDGTMVMEPNTRDGQSGTLMISPVRPNMDKPGPAALRIEIRPSGNFAPNNFAVIWDDQGHLVVPLAIEKEAMGNKPAPVSLNGTTVSAIFVGSDRQTGLTVLKAQQNLGRPGRLGSGRPADGALVMVLSPSQASARLTVWTGGQQDYGVVANTDGSIAGFARYGQFLSTGVCKAVVDQIIKTGLVKRAALGISIVEVRADDASRQELTELGNRPAMRIERVMDGSAASTAGLMAGDLILELAGEPVGDVPTFAAIVAARVGQTELRILRNGAERTISVKLDPR